LNITAKKIILLKPKSFQVRKSLCLALSAFVFVLLIPSTSCKKSIKESTFASPADTLTQDVYAIDSTASPSKGTILVAPYDTTILTSATAQGMLLLMDQSGKVLMKKTTPGLTYCLNRWTINGKTRYTYFINDPSTFHPTGFTGATGYWIIADSNLNQLQQIDFTPYGQGLFQPGQGLDLHDFILLSDSDYITLSYYAKNVNNIPARLSPAAGVTVITPLIEEVRNGQVVWTWEATSDTTFYGTSIQFNNFSDSVHAQDYIHMNSMYIDPRDNNLICSMRHQDQVIKINRQTGAVMWRLGNTNSDFPLTPDMVFLRQHHATLTDNNQTLLIFDDGEQLLRPYSRIVEFHLDEVNKVVSSFKYFNIPEPFTDYTGSVQKIGDDYFIGGGPALYLLDVNYNTGQKIIEFKGNKASYRAYKYPTATGPATSQN
jgi:arylsulfate sulfotransferase